MIKTARTTNHAAIKAWAEQRNGIPAFRQRNDELVIFFPLLDVDLGLIQMDWDDFLDTFEERQLAFQYATERDSNYYLMVVRN